MAEDRDGVRGRGPRGGTRGGGQENFSGGRMGGYGYEEGAELRVATRWGGL